jgi:carboxymethylenebutenolidase
VPAPGLVVLPPIFGLEPVMRTFADECAARGFVVLAVNQFWRDTEPQWFARDDEGRAHATPRAQRVDVAQLVGDVGTAIDYVRARPECSGRVGVVGFCFGGRYAFLAAARLDVDAVGAFHGTQIGISLADAPNVRVPLSFQFGGDDPLTPPAEIEAIRNALAHRGDAEIVVHPGAVHNFSLPGVPGYRADVMAAAEQHVFGLFDRMKEPTWA